MSDQPRRRLAPEHPEVPAETMVERMMDPLWTGLDRIAERNA